MNILLEKLQETGVDVEGTLERFLDKEELYIKFLVKFLNDNNMELLGEALNKADYESAFQYAHALKGLSANLGLETMQKHLENIVKGYRSSDFSVMAPNYEKLVPVYENIISAIKENQGL